MRNLTFTDEAWESYIHWQTQDKKTLKRINDLIQAAKRDLFAGLGKPEPLKHSLSGCWSRRIDETNRLVYEVQDDDLIIISWLSVSLLIRITTRAARLFFTDLARSVVVLPQHIDDLPLAALVFI